MKKKYFTACSVVILIVIGISLYVLLNDKTSWSNMQIKDFKISSFKDTWENYPFPAEKISPEVINTIIPNLEQNIDKTEMYKWKAGNNTYAFIYVIQLKNKPSDAIGENSIKSGQKYILNEEVYNYDVPITYENNKENMKLYLFDEDKFIFIIGGLWSFPEVLTKKIVNRYPSEPTASNFNINSNFANQLISYVSKFS